jgi:serine protease Do
MLRRRVGVLGALALTSVLGVGASGSGPAEAAEVRVVSLGGARLGVQLEDVDPGEAAALGLDAVAGARVVDVTEGSAAADAGIREGDVILVFDGEAIRSVAQIARLVRETPPGREVAVELLRDGARRTLRVTPREATLGKLLGDHLALDRFQVPRDFAFDFDFPDVDPGRFVWRMHPDRVRLGIRYQEISGQLARYFGLEREQGVLVVHVEEGSAAARAGLQAGDVLLDMAGRTIEEGEDLRRALRGAETGEATPLRVREARAWWREWRTRPVPA